MKSDSVTPKFIQFIPSALEDGLLYVSVEYATAVHLCRCGCGSKVVTPLSRADWALTFEGDVVSLIPSIGNWSFPCQSHYWITRNRVRWAPKMTAAQIEAGRQRDRKRTERYSTGRYDVSIDESASSRSWLGHLAQRILALVRK